MYLIFIVIKPDYHLGPGARLPGSRGVVKDKCVLPAKLVRPLLPSPAAAVAIPPTMTAATATTPGSWI